MAIGDDLFTMLGLIPARDRAGIARGTMADEAKASMAANGNAEGHALMATAPRPPDITLPDGVGAEYVSGKQRAAPYGGPSVLPPSLPPAQERTIAAGPAAAPPPEVKRNTDILFEAMQQQAKQQRMMQIINGIGQMVSGATGHGGGGGVSAGGGGGGGGGVGDLQSLLAMRDQETLKLQTVPELRRMFGWSEDRAKAAFDSGEYKKWLEPGTLAKLEADKLAAKSRMELAKPEVVAAIAKTTGALPEVVEADIRSGKIGQKEIADILHTQAQSGKLGADTAEARRATGEAEKADRAFAFYKDNPEAFAQLHGIKDVNEARAIVSDRKNYDKYQETSGPTAYGPEAGYTRAKREGYTGTRADWEKVKDTKDSPESKAYGQSLTDQVKEFGESQKTLNERVNNMTSARAMQEASLSDDLIVGSKLSDMTLNARKVAAKALGYADEAAEKTDVFKRLRDNQALQLQQTLKGQTSNADVEWLKGIAGSDEMSVASIRRLMLLQDKADRLMIEQHNKRLADAQASESGQAYKGYYPVKYPPPGPLLSELLRSKPKDIAAMKAADPADTQMQKSVREKYGPGVFEFVREHM